MSSNYEISRLPALVDVVVTEAVKTLLEKELDDYSYYHYLRTISEYRPHLLGSTDLGLNALNRMVSRTHKFLDIKAGIRGLQLLCEATADVGRGRAVYSKELVAPIEAALAEFLPMADRYETRTIQVKHWLPPLFELLIHASGKGFEVMRPYLDHKDMTFVLTEMSNPRLIKTLSEEDGCAFYRRLLPTLLLPDTLGDEDTRKVLMGLSSCLEGRRILGRILRVV